MKDLLNRLYRNHSLIYKILLYLATTFLIVFFFPTSGKFKYSFERGKPWQSEDLQAPFDFAIKKTVEELEGERNQVIENAVVYFDENSETKSIVLADFDNRFDLIFPDSIDNRSRNLINRTGKDILIELFSVGYLDKEYPYEISKQIAVLENGVQSGSDNYGSLISPNEVRTYLDDRINTSEVGAFRSSLLSLYFDILRPNLVLNQGLTDSALEEELSKISSVRGSIARETLIISKGEVVEGEKFKILKSLEAEYESQVWTEANYNWILVAYTLLVALALLMLLSVSYTHLTLPTTSRV